MWHSLLGIEQASDVIYLKTVSDDVKEGWIQKRPGYPGPVLQEGKLVMDWWGGKKSNWNLKAFNLMTVQLKNAAMTKWTYLPKYEDFYYENTVKRKFDNFRSKWRAGQSKHNGPDPSDFETEEQVTERLAETARRERISGRQCKRRHTVSAFHRLLCRLQFEQKYEIRMRICEQMILLKAGEGDLQGDLEFWRWALTVIQRYGHEGMSSEESGDDYQGKEYRRIYRVKIMVWRRRIDDLLKLIDDARHGDSMLFSLRGSTGVQRLRPDYLDPNWPRTRRDPVQELPYLFYDEDWFQEVDVDIRLAMLHVSSEEFRWLRSIV